MGLDIVNVESVKKADFEKLIIRHGRTGAPFIWDPEVTAEQIAEWREAERVAREKGQKSQSRVKRPAGAYYTRTTRFIDALDDKTNLMAWRSRMVLAGAAQDPSLVEGAVAAGRANPEGTSEYRAAMDELTEKAVEAARGNLKRDLGTALHAIFEDIDEGREPSFVPPEYEPLVESYREKTAGIRPVLVEQFGVLDEFQVAGTFDNLRWYQRDGEDAPRLRISDQKSGSLSTTGKFVLQLGAYSMMQKWDPVTNQRSPISHMGVDVDREFGLIVSIPSSGEDEVSVWEVDLSRAREGLLLCASVGEWRRFWGRRENEMKRVI